MIEGGVSNFRVVPEEGRQVLSSPEDWWTIAIGSGLRWTIDQLGKEAAARVREGEPTEKMLSMLHLNNPTLDWVQIAQAHGVPATRATTAEEFHKQFEAALGSMGPHLIEAQVVQDIQPVVDLVRKYM